jgi:putative colanic acid biosynthesis acetyltransferase WcaF
VRDGEVRDGALALAPPRATMAGGRRRSPMTEPRPYRSELSRRNRLARALWAVAWGVFCRPSPRPFHAWRRAWLRLFGARLDGSAVVYSSARVWAPWNLEMGPGSGLGDGVDCYNVDRIILEEGAIVSQYAFLCTASHDISDPGRRLVTAPIRLGRLSWICAGAFVHPGVTVGEGAIAAARAVVVKDVAPWAVVGGNPAKFLKTRVLVDSPPRAPRDAPASDSS